MRRSDDLVTPESFLRYLRGNLKLKPFEIRLPRRGLMVFGSQDFEMFRRALRGKRARWTQWQSIGRAGRNRIALERSYIGGPAAATVLEEMAVRGVRDCISFGACGSLRADLRVGSLVLPTFACPDEGTSKHYGSPRRPRPHPVLLSAIRAACVRAGLPFTAGGLWTSDAPYRETWSKARRFSNQGAVAVEMEASALYAVARYRRIRIASLMVVSDELGGSGWNPGFMSPVFLAAKRRAARALVDALARPWA